MTNLYIEQIVFSLHEKFRIFDENKTPLYYAEGELLTLGKKLHLYNKLDEELISIEQRLLSFLPFFRIYHGEEQIAEITKEFSFFHPTYTVGMTDGRIWTVDGDFLSHDYKIRENEAVIAQIAKQYMSFGDTYEIRIYTDIAIPMILATVLTIDAVLAMQ